MLKEIDHSKIEYMPFRKNLYIVPKALSKLTELEAQEKRYLSFIVCIHAYPLSYGFPCYLQGGFAHQSARARLSYAGRYMGKYNICLTLCMYANHRLWIHATAGAMRAI